MRTSAIARQDTAAHDAMSRRNWLSSTGLQTAGLGAVHQFWNTICQAGSQPNTTASLGTNTRRAKSVIMIFNCGAPSHIDLWDMKPDAPSELRGLFQPIPTNVPGIEISELLPEVAKRRSEERRVGKECA